MPVGLINIAKEQAVAYKPLLLCRFTFDDGSILRITSDPLSVAQGGYQYGGHDWLGRLTNQDIAVMQAMSAAVDHAGQVQLEMADPDKYLYLTWDQAAGKGFKGAKLELLLVFWNVGANDFSSDAKTVFVGYCDSPKGTPTHLTVSAVSRLDFSKAYLPPVKIQKRCPWIFPANAAERAAAHNDPGSDWYECGYCPESGVGTAGFVDCDYTKTGCEARGMYDEGRFGGIQWAPPATFRSRSFTEGGKWIEGNNSSNEAKYNDYIPMVYGKGWVEPPILDMMGGGDVTGFEAVLCLGEVDNIEYVVVNDTQLQQARSMEGAPYRVDDPLLIWEVSTRGSRDGVPTAAPPFDSKGDPHGSMAVIVCGVYKRIASTESTPRVRVLLSGPKIRVFSDPTTSTLEGAPYNQNPVWQYIDLATWGPARYEDFNIAKAIATAAKCQAAINYTDLHGATSSHPRFSSSLVIRQRTALDEVLRGLRNANRLMIYQENGLIQIDLEETLADQQPAPVAGSNDTAPYASKTAAGSAANGYVAYHFDESSLLLRNGQSTLRLVQSAIAETPNVINCEFQDADNLYFPDSITQRDPKDIARSKREVDTQLVIKGLQTYDQAKRVMATTFSKIHNGNVVGDTRGTIKFEFETTVKAAHLHAGHIVSLSHAQWNLTKQLFRVESIQPTMNYDVVKIRVAWHNDNWYLDTHGQVPDPEVSNPRRDRLARPPYGWMPNQVAAAAGDSLVAQNDLTFAISQEYEDLADGAKMVRLVMTGKPPVNEFGEVEPPFVRQGVGSLSGGDLDAGIAYWACVSAKDANGKLSPPCAPIKVFLPDGATNGSFSLPNISWASGTAGYVVFAGTDPNHMAAQLEAGGTSPNLISISEPLLAQVSVKSADITQASPTISGFARALQVPAGPAASYAYMAASVSSGVSYTISFYVQMADNSVPVPGGSALASFDFVPIIGGQPVSSWSLSSIGAGVYKVTGSCTLTGTPNPSLNGVVRYLANSGKAFKVTGFTLQENSAGATPSTITITSLKRRTWGPPDVEFDHLKWRIKRVRHSGIAYGVVSSVTAGSITISGGAYDVNEFADRDASVLGVDSTDPVPVANFRIQSNTANVLTLAAGAPSPVALGINAGDLVIIRSTPTVGSNYLEDAGWESSQYPTGMEVDAEAGAIVRIISGPGEGFTYKIASNTSTRITIDTDWVVPPTSASRYIIEEPDWQIAVDSSPVDNTDPNAEVTSRVDVSNLLNKVLLVMAVAVDGGGAESWERLCPFREIYVYGEAGTGGLVAPQDVTITGSSYAYTAPDANGKRWLEVTVEWTPDPGDSVFAGGHIYYENPDRSAAPEFKLDGTTPLDATTQLAGEAWKAADAGKHQGLSGTFRIEPVSDSRTLRLYVASFSNAIDNPLVRATEPDPTPSVTLAVAPYSENAGSGAEVAPLVLAPYTAAIEYDWNEAGDQIYRLVGSWTNPVGDPRYSGVKVIYKTRDTEVGLALELDGATTFATDWWTVPPDPVTFLVAFLSYNSEQRRSNSFVAGTTPSVELTVSRQTGTSGQERAPFVTGFTASVGYATTYAGNDGYFFAGSWTNPTDTKRFRGVKLVARFAGDPLDRVLAIETEGSTTFKTQAFEVGFNPVDVAIYAVSIDANNRANSITGSTPKVDLQIDPQLGQSGEERAPMVTDYSASVGYTVSEAGDDMYFLQGDWSNPADLSKFRGVKVVARFPGDPVDRVVAIETEGIEDFLTTPWPAPSVASAVSIYYVSLDANNRANTITGNTPRVDLTIEPQVGAAGTERAPNVTGFTAAVQYGTDEIGGQRYRMTGTWALPADREKFRGVKVVARNSGNDSILAIETDGATSFLTDWWPVPDASEGWTIYAVSIDANNRANTITGSTPSYAVSVNKSAGTLKLNRTDLSTVSSEFRLNGITGKFEMHAVDFSKATAFDLQMFEVSAGTFKYKELLVEKLKGTVASFGGVGQAGLLAVFNSTGSLIGWIGDDRFARTGYPGTGSGFEGAWFLRLLIGGTSPSTAKIIADSSGNVAINGATFTLTLNGYVTTIGNVSDGGSIAGLRISDVSSTNIRHICTAQAMALYNAFSQPQVTIANLAYGYAQFYSGATLMASINVLNNGRIFATNGFSVLVGGVEVLGPGGTVTIPKLTTGGANGSITFVGGMMTAFVNPT